MKVFNLVFINIIILSANLYSQVNDIKFIHLTEGLSQSSVSCILQDKRGFMWFGTVGGLNRYDGTEYVVYQNIFNDTTSLSANWVTDILEDNEGNLWIATADGLNLFNRSTNKFIRYVHNKQVIGSLNHNFVNTILEDSRGNLWVGTDLGGLDMLNKRENNFIHYKNNPDDSKSLSSNMVHCLYEDRNGNLWVGTGDGKLNLFDRNDRSFTQFKFDNGQANSLSLGRFRKIVEDNHGKFWIAVQSTGLISVENYRAGHIYYKQFVHDENNENSLTNNYILSMYKDNSGRLWIGSEHGGIDIFDVDTKNFKHIKNNPNDEYSISSDVIWSIYQDQIGRMWIGTFDKGLNVVDKYHDKFITYAHQVNNINSLSYNNIAKFFEDKLGNIWIATDGGGLNYFDREKNSFVHYRHNKNDRNSLSSDAVISLFEDSEGNLWVGTWIGGINVLSKDKKTFKHYNKENGSLKSNNVHDIIDDNEGNIFIATNRGGLNVYDPKTKLFFYYNHDEKDDKSLSSDAIIQLFRDSKGQIWIGTEGNGLDLLKKDLSGHVSFVHYRNDPTEPGTLSDNIVQSIYEDSQYNLWIGTNNGLNLMDKKSGTFTVFREEDGLPSNTINGILEDNLGNLWLSTLKGLSKFNPETKTFKNFDVSDGLQGNEFNGKDAAIKSRTGELFFGGRQGFNIVHPENIIENPFIPPVYITDFEIFNKSVGVGTKNSPLKKNITETNEITLSYKQSVFSFKFVALNYTHPEKNQYKYILEGFDKDWNYVGTKHTATYTNLNPGEYSFRVKASNNDGIWNEQGTSIKITILPPWWKTLWFKFVLGIFLISSAITLYRYSINRLKTQQLILEQKVNERTNELTQANTLLEEKQEEITIQNTELDEHRHHLEQLVEERTAELEKARKKAEESDKLKSAFLANMSHEIRTPMNAIVGFSSLLQSFDITNNEKKEYISNINNNCNTLLVLINDLLEISLIEADQVNINKSPFEVNRILEELENYFKIKNDKAINISFVKKRKNHKLILNNDAIRFRQIFTNILDNALKYTEAGYINFGYEILDNEIKFFVADTGIGISKPEYENIFDHFHKIETDKTKFYRGTGLGLSISKKLVEFMGGKIWLESQLGVGTTFYFTLPYLERTMTYKSVVIEEKELKLNLEGIRILVAEDDPTNFNLIKKILEPSKVEIIWARNGNEAVEFIKSNVDFRKILVLMDIKMPEMDGIEAIRIIRKINKDIPVIAVTAYAHETDKSEILKNGFNDFIVKPLKPKILLEVINKYI